MFLRLFSQWFHTTAIFKREVSALSVSGMLCFKTMQYKVTNIGHRHRFKKKYDCSTSFRFFFICASITREKRPVIVLAVN